MQEPLFYLKRKGFNFDSILHSDNLFYLVFEMISTRMSSYDLSEPRYMWTVALSRGKSFTLINETSKEKLVVNQSGCVHSSVAR